MRERWIPAAIAIAAASAQPSQAMQIGWRLDEPDCVANGTVVEIQCGEYGVFHVGGPISGACVPIVSGEDEPLFYPPPSPLATFPFPARHLQESSTQPSPLGSTKRWRARGALAAKVAPGPAPTPAPWIAVVDFDGPHGDSTTWLAGEVAGIAVETVLAKLDDPTLAGLGDEVGDFHVLAKLCEIAELVDHGGRTAPLAVNMSFGRAPAPTDPVSATDCVPTRVSCQIARVVAHLRARRTAFVAAAGNHRELLFPASLPEVVAAGMLDVERFLRDGVATPAWETPDGAEGWVPGNALCLDSWAAPAGSSYSSALLTGWFAKLLRVEPLAQLTGGDPWVPKWDEERQCFVLARGDTRTSWCNTAVRELLEGLAGGNATTCWSIATSPSETVPLVARVQAEPSLPSFDRFAAGEHPTPEPDPCVPCVAFGEQGGEESLARAAGGDLTLDLSQTPALPAGTHIDALSLRIGTSYHPLTLTPAQIAAVESGSLAQLVLLDAFPLVVTGEQVSLWYQLKADLAADCADPGACYWSSTPVLVPAP